MLLCSPRTNHFINFLVYGYKATGKDFLYFVHSLFQQKKITLKERDILSAVEDRDSKLDPQWLAENPICDAQGIPWYNLNPNRSECQAKIQSARDLRSSLHGGNVPRGKKILQVRKSLH